MPILLPNTLIQYSLAIPFIADCVSAIIPYKNIRDILLLIISPSLIFIIFNIYKNFSNNIHDISWNLWELLPGIKIAFSVEPLGIIFSSILSILWFISTIYSIGYLRANKEENHNRFFCFFSLAIFSSIGLAFSANLITLFIFYELLTLTTYPLVTHHKNNESRKAGRLYLFTLMGASMLFFLPAIILTFNISGNINFIKGGFLFGKDDYIIITIFVLYILGAAKSALMPIHKWLPSAMVAPAPVSALLHAVAVVKAGVFTIIKLIVYVFGIENLNNITIRIGEYSNVFIYFAAFSVIVASLIALRKKNLKQLLAYSTISQLGYIVMSAFMFTPKAILAACMYFIAHAFAKVTLFFSVGAIYTTSHYKKTNEIYGIGKKMPITMTAFSIAAIAMIGLPPTFGFIAKWYVIDAAMDIEQSFVVLVVLVSTMLNSAYFLPIIYKAFFCNSYNEAQIKEAPILMLLPIIFTSLIPIALFIWPDYTIKLVEMLL